RRQGLPLNEGGSLGANSSAFRACQPGKPSCEELALSSRFGWVARYALLDEFVRPYALPAHHRHLAVSPAAHNRPEAYWSARPLLMEEETRRRSLFEDARRAQIVRSPTSGFVH